MNIEIIYWEIKDSDPSISVLNRLIDKDCLSQWSSVENIVDKLWFENQSDGYWGAIVIWDKEKPDLSSLPPNKPKSIIGREPDVRLSLDLISRL
ncbi:hypothetical protein VIBNISOn1_30270 [Vibrio nigripulchritudo SOn1]|uniref:Uncharacterized protein n=1 Tax=Vibrio nigripulchritudo SOn1 TaxID=1238450 RepID=A0AAV2VT25_9VIBR|nr:hypothetical protein [Vibrio nigripulchritudo]CCO47570.1 hypothetical protein VIBNISOn1_30270 [Vibrio nigripulchritudo SOn1]